MKEIAWVVIVWFVASSLASLAGANNQQQQEIERNDWIDSSLRQSKSWQELNQ